VVAPTPPVADRRGLTLAALLVGFAGAVWLRVVLGGAQVAQSAPAGLLFAAALLVLTWAAGVRLSSSGRALAVGLAGAAVLCLPAGIARLAAGSAHQPAGSFVRWALVVTIVACAEELFLRGALFDAVMKSSRRPELAVVVAAVCFAGLHVPLYGWRAVPLDLAVGCGLGVLRLIANSPFAPATAHVLADLAGWWLV
jgi:hypothetical protein